ncbi:MAG TPA: TetR/AcrR family transcriptional regulator [Longimicrobium sp.]|jgi:AcrR family transcriptional regulator
MEVREKLMEAALRVFEEAGSRGATTRRIAAEAGVNEITLFRHFGSKAALLSEAILAEAQRGLDYRLPDAPEDPAAELTAWCTEHLAHLRRNSGMIRTCMGEMENAPEMRACAQAGPQRVAEELTGYFERLRERGMSDPGADPGAAAAMLMGALFTDAMGREMMPERYAYSPEEAPEKYVTLLLRGIGATPPSASKT